MPETNPTTDNVGTIIARQDPQAANARDPRPIYSPNEYSNLVYVTKDNDFVGVSAALEMPKYVTDGQEVAVYALVEVRKIKVTSEPKEQ